MKIFAANSSSASRPRPRGWSATPSTGFDHALVRNSRRPLNTTSRLAPISANTAIHIVACPIKVRVMKTALIPSASEMFCLSTAAVSRESRMNVGILRRSSIHDRDVGGLDGRVGACGTHGETDVGAGKSRRIVDAVAHHGDLVPGQA